MDRTDAEMRAVVRATLDEARKSQRREEHSDCNSDGATALRSSPDSSSSSSSFPGSSAAATGDAAVSARRSEAGTSNEEAIVSELADLLAQLELARSRKVNTQSDADGTARGCGGVGWVRFE